MQNSGETCTCHQGSLHESLKLALLIRSLPIVLIFMIRIPGGVAGGQTDFRLMITTDLAEGVDVLCRSEDGVYQMTKRKILPEDTDYTFPFDETHPVYLSHFLCTVIDSLGNEMMFTAWDPRILEKPWKFPEIDGKRDVRWSVNNAGVWIYLKGRRHADSIMRWMFAGVWPHLQMTNSW